VDRAIRRATGEYSNRPVVPYGKQDIQHLAERVVTARIEAMEAQERQDEAVYHYVECLEARLKAASAGTAA